MNPRSFTMGIGTGLIVACLILGVFYKANKAHWNDELAAQTNAPTQTVEPTAEPAVAPTLEPTAEPTVEPTTEPTAEPTPEPTTPPPQTTEEPTPEPTEEPTPEPTVEPTAEPTAEPAAVSTAEPTADVVSVFIPQRATAAEVASLLRDNGVVSDSEAFVRHLIDAGVTQRIWYGTFKLSAEMGFDEITAIITKSP